MELGQNSRPWYSKRCDWCNTSHLQPTMAGMLTGGNNVADLIHCGVAENAYSAQFPPHGRGDWLGNRIKKAAIYAGSAIWDSYCRRSGVADGDMPKHIQGYCVFSDPNPPPRP